MFPRNRMRRVVLGLLALAVLAPSTAVAALKPPKQLCLVWTSQLDANDTWEMNLLLRAVPGKINAQFAVGTPAVLKFYQLNGMAVHAPSDLFPTLHGSGWLYTNGGFLVLSVSADSGQGSFLFRGSLGFDPLAIGLTRIAPDGSVTLGDSTLRPCSEVVIDD